MECIKCPNCGTEIPIETALFKKAEEKAREEYDKKISDQMRNFKQQQEHMEEERKRIEAMKTEQEGILEKRLAERLKEESEKLKKDASEKVEDEMRLLREENERKKNENKELRQKEVEILKKERELKELWEQADIDLQKRMLERQEEIEKNITARESERYELKIREYDKKLDDQKKLIDEMKRKAEQGSMQMQGEIQELALEEMLVSLFPYDSIEPVPKGAAGADVIQNVRNEFQQACGKIIYESKRTKAFSDNWIEKLKADMMNTGSSLAVIVTEALPKDMSRFGKKDGVWICGFNEIRSVAYILREMLLREYAALSSVSNKGDKMELLYKYLTSENFKQRVESIVEGFCSIKEQLDSEKRAMQRIWKEREKQLETVIGNTIDMYGSIKGIAGNAIVSVRALELPGDGPEAI